MLPGAWKAPSAPQQKWRGTELRWLMQPLRSSWKSRQRSGTPPLLCSQSCVASIYIEAAEFPDYSYYILLKLENDSFACEIREKDSSSARMLP